MKVTYNIMPKGSRSSSVSLGTMSIEQNTVTIVGSMDEVKELTEWLEQKYDLA